MPEKEIEGKTNESTEPVSSTEADEAKKVLEMKKEMDSLKAENASLRKAKADYYDAVLNENVPEEEPKKRTVKEIRDELVKRSEEGCTNLEYATLAVELDNACKAEKNGQSCFLPKGRDVTPTADEYAVASKMNAVLSECIEESEGDPDLFNMQLEKHLAKSRR